MDEASYIASKMSGIPLDRDPKTGIDKIKSKWRVRLARTECHEDKWPRWAGDDDLHDKALRALSARPCLWFGPWLLILILTGQVLTNGRNPQFESGVPFLPLAENATPEEVASVNEFYAGRCSRR
jgi:hypothetical protein